jgi:hypothetical protein
MTLQGFVGYDDTQPEVALAGTGGSSGITGRSGRGLAVRNSSSSKNLFIMPTALSTLYVGFGFRTNTLAGSRFVTFMAPDHSTKHCAVGLDNSGNVTIYGPADTVVATSAIGAIFTGSVWCFIEVKVVISDTVGIVEVRKDESVVLTYNGDTRNGTATTVGYIDSIVPAGINIDIDDLWVDDAGYLGDKTVEWLTPNGNGSSSGWLGSDGNSTDNYLLVDDPTTANVTDYVAASVSGTLDLYTMGDLPTGYSVDAIQEAIFVQKSDAGTPPTVLPVAKGALGTTRTDTAIPALSTTAQYQLGQLRTTDPDGNPLTAARVNGMEVGVKIQ